MDALGLSLQPQAAQLRQRPVTLLLVNKCLRNYNNTFFGPQHFNFMVHPDTDDLANVYTIRAGAGVAEDEEDGDERFPGCGIWYVMNAPGCFEIIDFSSV